MYTRPVRNTETLSPSNMEFEEKKDDVYSNDKDKKAKVRFKLSKSNLFSVLFCSFP